MTDDRCQTEGVRERHAARYFYNTAKAQASRRSEAVARAQTPSAPSAVRRACAVRANEPQLMSAPLGLRAIPTSLAGTFSTVYEEPSRQ